jgi:hypothetical protein
MVKHAQPGRGAVDWSSMAVEMQNTGDSSLKADVVASIEHALADRPGDWRILNGSQPHKQDRSHLPPPGRGVAESAAPYDEPIHARRENW